VTNEIENIEIDKVDIPTTYDISTLAKEYADLMKYNYGFLLENEEYVKFRFGMDDFYHFLGFHKLTYSMGYYLVKNNYIQKKDFFKLVMNPMARLLIIMPSI